MTLKTKLSVSWNTSFVFFILCCLLQTEFRVLFSCMFLSLAALVTVVPTSAPQPLLWWFSFLLDCMFGELIWVKNTPYFWVAYLFKLRSVTWPSSSYGVMNRSIGIARAVQFWVLDKVAFCWSWQLKEMLVKLVSVAFNVGVNQSDLNSSERRKRKHAYSFFVSMLSTYFVFPSFLLF